MLITEIPISPIWIFCKNNQG